MADRPAEPPFIRVGPEMPACPVILSVPHAGRVYSPALLRAARLPRLMAGDPVGHLVELLPEKLPRMNRPPRHGSLRQW